MRKGGNVVAVGAAMFGAVALIAALVLLLVSYVAPVVQETERTMKARWEQNAARP